MTNLPEIGDQTVVTNADGSVTITTVTEVKWGFSPTPVDWVLIAVVVAAIALVIIYFSQKKNNSD